MTVHRTTARCQLCHGSSWSVEGRERREWKEADIWEVREFQDYEGLVSSAWSRTTPVAGELCSWGSAPESRYSFKP